jgi:Ankyrin repeats (many copies)
MADPQVEVESPGEDRPLRSLSAEDISLVAEQVPHLGGTVDVYRHYLPRILDIAVNEGFDWPDFEVVMGHLAFTHRFNSVPWTEWPEPEQAALRIFFDAAWTVSLTEGLALLSADDLICGLSCAAVDLSPFLERWTSFANPISAQQLQWYLEENAGLTDGRLRNAFWATEKPWEAANMRRLVRWAHSEQLKMHVRLVLEHPFSNEEAEALTRCHALLPGENRFAPSDLENAIHVGDLNKVMQLLAAGADPNEVDEVVGTRLWELAFELGEYQICHALIDAGADLEAAAEGGATFLNRIVESSTDPDRVRQILLLGANPMGGDDCSWTPLHDAASSGNLEVSRLLYAAGADPNATRSRTSPLQLAIKNGHSEIVELLSHPIR